MKSATQSSTAVTFQAAPAVGPRKFTWRQTGAALATVLGFAFSALTLQARPVTASAQEAETFVQSHEGLLASIDAGDGVKVEFYELDPGVILVSETGPIGAGPRVPEELGRGLSAVKAFQRLAPDARVPEKLQAAQTRVDAASTLASSFRPSDVGPLGATTADGAPSAVDYQPGAVADSAAPTDSSKGCDCGGKVGNTPILCLYHAWCWNNRTNTSFWSRSGLKWIDNKVTVTKGKVRVRLQKQEWGEWKTKVTSEVPKGYYVKQSFETGSWFGDNLRSIVDEAGGDTYHHSGTAGPI